MRRIYPDQRVHIPFPLRQLTQHLARHVVQIEVVVAVAVGMPDELIRALDEGRIAPRIDPGFVLLRQNEVWFPSDQPPFCGQLPSVEQKV